MARAKRPAGKAGLVHDVERQWCELSSAMAVFQTRSAAEQGLTVSDLQAVDILARESTVCASELAEECGLTRGAITGMLNRLERAGVARRDQDQGDGRRLVIQAVLTPSGCDCRVPEILRNVVAGFTAADLKPIQRFLNESARAVRQEAAQLQKKQQRPQARTTRRASRKRRT